MEKIKFGENLFNLRKINKITQTELGKMLGVTNKAISKWENGESLPSVEQIIELSKIYGVSTDKILLTSNDEKKKRIYKIAITGGPCSGKSTALSWIQTDLRKKGIKVLFVPESATELILGGINLENIHDNFYFEKYIMSLQLEKEKLFWDAANHVDDCDKVIIVCDRGIMDCKAYMSESEFNRCLKELNKNLVELRDSYDMVIHLVTAADGASEFYNNDNLARRETKEEAIEADRRTLNQWIGHPHLRVIDNSTDFEHKMRRLVHEITEFVGTNEPYEIERKFLIEYPNLEKLEKLPNCKKVEIVQTYLKTDNNNEIRVRQRGENGFYLYSKTRKTTINDIKRIEVETRISEKEYLDLLMEADLSIGQIRKTRYCLSYKNQYFEIDIYPFWKDKATLEIELKNEDEKINFPKFLKIIKEVTGDDNYKNKNLAKSFKN